MVKQHNNNQMRTVLAKMTKREARRLSLTASGKQRRQREQLCLLGKQDRKASVKKEFNVPSRWAEIVPAEVPFTVEGLLRAMVTGKTKPLYDVNGKHCAGPASAGAE